MELLLTDEQALLSESAAKLLAQAGGVKRARRLRGAGGEIDRAVLREMGEAGWLSILVPTAHDGLGLGLFELALVLEQAGSVLAPEPVAPCALAAWAIAGGGNAALRDGLLGAVTSGEAIIVPVVGGGGSAGADRAGHDVAATLTGDGARLTGIADLVPAAAHADGFLVEAQGADGPVLCHVERGAAGLEITLSTTVDGRAHGRLTLSNVVAAHVIGGKAVNCGRLYNMELVAASAEMLGVMSAANEMTVDYLKSRVQFGRPIGSFQALQHRAVDDYTRISSTRALLYQLCGQGEFLAPAMASALKAFASSAGLAVTKSAIQLHGAIGFTDEHDIGLFLKRAMWLSAWLGNETEHSRRFDALNPL